MPKGFSKRFHPKQPMASRRVRLNEAARNSNPDVPEHKGITRHSAFGRIIKTRVRHGREEMYHATKGWRSYRA